MRVWAEAQALDQATDQLSKDRTVEKLNNDLSNIEKEMRPEVINFSEVKEAVKTPDPLALRDEKIKEMANQYAQQDKEPIVEAVEVEANTPQADNTPYSDILAQTLTINQKRQAEEMAQRAGESANSPIVSTENQEMANKIATLLPDDLSQTLNFGVKNGQYLGGKGGYSGHCAYEAEQWTTLPDGSNWTIGDTIADKKTQLAGHVKNGNGFYLGQDVPQVGNSIVFNGDKWGHVAVITKINPDGTAQLTESNYNNDKRVTTDRIVSLSDPSILGFLKTVPRKNG